MDKETAKLRELVELSKDVLSVGNYLANVAYNLKQTDNLSEGDKKVLDKWQTAWDSVSKAYKEKLNKV